MKNSYILCIAVFNTLIYASSVSAAKDFSSENMTSSYEPEYINTSLYNKNRRKILYTNLALTTGVIYYGYSIWDWGKSEFHTTNEGWLSDNTQYGGADKLGHFYTGYAITRLTSALYKSWGVPEKTALRNALISSVLFTTGTEIGDGFSKDYGFSYEDFISNTLGQLAGYYLETHPELDKKVDIRLEYNFDPSESSYDPVSSYNNMKTLIAIKASGFNYLNKSPFKYLELHLGYYSRGFQESTKYPNPERHFYTGIGINVSEIFKQLKFNKTAKVFNYYQLPGTYIE